MCVRRNTQNQFAQGLTDSEPTPVTDPDAPALHHSTHPSRPPDKYGFSHSTLFAILSTISIPSTCRLLGMTIGHMLRTKNSMPLKKISYVGPHSLPTSYRAPIGCKWISSFKLEPDNTLDHYKARLVALGNCQEYGIDYD